MLKAIWFLLRIGAFIAAALWIAEQTGSVQIEWNEYRATIHMGVFLGVALGVILVANFIYQALQAIVKLPSAYGYYKRIQDKDKGYRALTAGLSAVAAGDGKAAAREAKRARKLLPRDEEHGLPLLLEAQAARLSGDEDEAKQRFVALLEHKDASFLGLRGLIQSSMENGDDAGALEFAKKALALHPKQGWILKIVYDLHLRLKQWSDAQALISRLLKVEMLDAHAAVSDRVALALAIALEGVQEGLHDVAQGQFRKARRLDPSHVAAVALEAEYWQGRGDASKARRLIKSAWKKGAHDALVPVWQNLIPENRNVDALSRLKWLEELLRFHDGNAAGHLAAGNLAIEAGLWGEARDHLNKALDVSGNVEVYKAFVNLERREGGDEINARAYMDQASSALPAPAWVCSESGLSYEKWSPVAAPHGSFNTIAWDVPNTARAMKIFAISNDGGAFLDAPKLQA